MSWTTIRDAVHGVLASALDLAADLVLWDGYGAPQPDEAYATLTLGAARSIGRQWQQVALDGATYIETLARPYELDLTIECHNDLEAQARLQAAIAALDSAANTATLDAAGIAVLRTGVIQNLGAFALPEFQARAQVQLTLGVTLVVESDVGVIETAEVARTAPAT